VTRRDALPRWFVPAWVAACCLGTLAAKLAVNAERTQVNHGDISFYYSVARNLVEGRGFVIDYIWNFWSHPEGVPTPSNVWWMPLASVIGAAGMWLGRPDYVSAQRAMIVCTSVLPLVMYLLGRDSFRSRAVGLVGALLATTFHLFLDQPSAPLSHGPYVVLAASTLWLIVRSLDDPRFLKWVGAAIALTQLARSDGVVLFAALVAAHLVQRKRPPWRAVLAVPLAYALVMSPWWAHNLSVHGTPMPGGSFRAVFLPHYEAWYSLPESVTAGAWLADGWGPVLEAKWRMSTVNLETAATGLVAGAADRKGAWEHAPLLAVLGLSWLGLLFTLRRRFVAFWTTWLMEWVFYSLVFTAVGSESFRTGMYSVYPMLVLCAAAGLLVVARALARLLAPAARRAHAATVLVGVVAAWVVTGQLAFAHAAMENKVAGIRDLNNAFTVMRNRMFVALGLQDELIMARDVHQLWAIAGIRGVMIPFEPEPVVREVARRYGVRYILIMGDPGGPSLRPALDGIETDPHYERVFGPMQVTRWHRFQLYRILD
jgi:hypothetical protein